MFTMLTSVETRWKSTSFSNQKKEKYYEELMKDPKNLGKIVANRSMKEVINKVNKSTQSQKEEK